MRQARIDMNQLNDILKVQDNNPAIDLTQIDPNEEELQILQETENTPKQFENKVRSALSEYLGFSLAERKMTIAGMTLRLDIVNEDKKVMGDVKMYRYTSSGKWPSAKISILSYYALFMKLYEIKRGESWTKIFVIGDQEAFVDEVVRVKKEMLKDIDIYYYSKNTGIRAKHVW